MLVTELSSSLSSLSSSEEEDDCLLVRLCFDGFVMSLTEGGINFFLVTSIFPGSGFFALIVVAFEVVWWVFES